MSLTRRKFLQHVTISLPASILAARGLSGAVMAAPVPGQSKNLILVEMIGGNDGLNTLPPWGFSAYSKVFRPTIAVPAAKVLKVAGQNVVFFRFY